MAELRIWMAVLSRPEIQNLGHEQRDALFAIAATVADLETTPDGFLPSSALVIVPWRHGPQGLAETIEELCACGLLERFDDPAGWLVPGWTDHAQHYRHGDPMAWGQMSVERLHEAREHGRKRTAQSRAKRAAEAAPPPDSSCS